MVITVSKCVLCLHRQRDTYEAQQQAAQAASSAQAARERSDADVATARQKVEADAAAAKRKADEDIEDMLARLKAKSK